MIKIRFNYLRFCLVLLFLAGCGVNKDLINIYVVNEPAWIRDGKPINFEEGNWYPTDNVENLLDKEMVLMGEYEGAQFFTERKDIRPFAAIFTKFDNHQYREFDLKND